MKTNKFYTMFVITLLSVLTFGLASCSSDDDKDTSAPTIHLEEANIEGDELCVEADIVAEGRTAAIVIDILDAKSGAVKVNYPVTNSKYIGVLNIDGFHVHAPIAGKNVVVGDQLKLSVTDAKGKTTSETKDITEEEDEDEKPLE